ncbi:MAG: hypothetical protein KatS3mg008_1069 [Acidimicrobiales bacterium]|nr:MAG: hypothetical protein KatS3mg008_1069 [Acidimicrobiales bacterium]
MTAVTHKSETDSHMSSTIVCVVSEAHSIPAPPVAVWSEITPLERLASWNDLFLSAEGVLRRGARLDLKLVVPDRDPLHLRPRVIEVAPPARLCLGCETADGISFRADYQLSIEERGSGSQVAQVYRCSGHMPEDDLKAIAARFRGVLMRFGEELVRHFGGAHSRDAGTI